METQSKESRSTLLNKLWKYQWEKGYISFADIRTISRELKISISEISGVISFYHFFHTVPQGRYIIYLNTGIVSQMKGYQDVKKAFEKETGAKIGTKDSTGTFSLKETSCIGLCDQEPAALINFRPFVNLTPQKVKKIITALKNKANLDELADKVEDSIRHTLGDKSYFFADYKQGSISKKFLKMDPIDIIEEIKWSELSGRGGAFFPTGLKWDICRKSFSHQKYIICNADEGEPGTFKDRFLLNQRIGLLLEGMTLAAYTVGATKGVIYLRAEYYYLKDKIEKEITSFYENGLLGENILGNENFYFDIRIQMGAGAYVCGEETALIESMEGKRGEPRTKTYFPVKKGYFYKPTVVNNVETYCAAARIIELGAPRFKEMGTSGSTGVKLLSISGDCTYPGIYEIEWGIKISELLTKCGAKDTAFVQWSGPSGYLLAKEDFDKAISKEDYICSGSVMIFNKTRDLFEVMQNFTQFFIDESCGLCTPCRAGNYLVGRQLSKIDKHKARLDDVKDLKKWAHIIKNTSRCGLGKTSNNFLLDAIEKFPDIFKHKLQTTEDIMETEFSLEESLVDYAGYVTKMSKDG